MQKYYNQYIQSCLLASLIVEIVIVMILSGWNYMT